MQCYVPTVPCGRIFCNCQTVLFKREEKFELHFPFVKTIWDCWVMRMRRAKEESSESPNDDVLCKRLWEIAGPTLVVTHNRWFVSSLNVEYEQIMAIIIQKKKTQLIIYFLIRFLFLVVSLTLWLSRMPFMIMNESGRWFSMKNETLVNSYHKYCVSVEEATVVFCFHSFTTCQ